MATATLIPLVLLWLSLGFGVVCGGVVAYFVLSAPLAAVRAALDQTYADALGTGAKLAERLRTVEVAKQRNRALLVSPAAVTLVALINFPGAQRGLVDVGVATTGGNPVVLAVLALAAGVALRAVVAVAEIGLLEGAFGAVAKTGTRILEAVGDTRIDQAALAEHARAARNEERYRANLGSAFELKQIELGEVGIFRDLAWNFEPGVNILLGRNGYGKSFLLRLIVACLTNDTQRLNELTSPAGGPQRMLLYLTRNSEAASIERKGALLESDCGKIPVLAIPDSRFISRAKPSVSSEGDDYADLARYGAQHFLWDLPYETSIQTVMAQMCIDYLARRGRSGPPRSPQLDLASALVRDLSGEGFAFHEIKQAGSARFGVMVETDSSPGRPIPIQQASQGTLSVVAIAALVYQFLRSVHPDAEEAQVCERRAIVFIDEVDAHLHPAWQRKIVYLLRQRFPQVQFILTAHSPLVVAGCGPGEVSVLRREGDGLKVVEFQKGFIGARPEDIYRELFEIEELDAAFLGQQARLPELPRLRRELEDLKTEAAPDAGLVSRMEQTVESIARTKVEKEPRLERDDLVRENEQLRRQLAAERTRDARSIDPRSTS